MKKRKIFFPIAVLSIGGRILCLAALWVYTHMAVQIIQEWEWNVKIIIVDILGICLGYVPGAITFHYFWFHFFGKLIITEGAVIWRCLFMRSRRIPKDQCRYVVIKNVGAKGYTDMSSQGTLYVFFTTQPFSDEIPVYKVRNSDDLIRFPLTKRLCGCLAEWLPPPKNIPFQDLYQKTQLERQRAKQRKQRKRLKKRERREKLKQSKQQAPRK